MEDMRPLLAAVGLLSGDALLMEGEQKVVRNKSTFIIGEAYTVQELGIQMLRHCSNDSQQGRGSRGWGRVMLLCRTGM